jgi:phosphoglycerate dehydrogenase-like enzyme
MVLLFGFGMTGREAAKIPQPLGIHVLTVTRSGAGNEERPKGYFPHRRCTKRS